MLNIMKVLRTYKDYLEMEEQYSVKQISLNLKSGELNELQASIYDFQDSLLQKTVIFAGVEVLIPLAKGIKNFYILLNNKSQQLSELYSYFWPDGISKGESIRLTQSFKTFTIQIQITIDMCSQFVLQVQSPSKQEKSSQNLPDIKKVDEKQYMFKLKQRVFRVLQMQHFFKDDEGDRKCNYIRKNKTHKNLTTLLVKNSSNILKTLNQSINQKSVLKSYNQIQTNDSTEKEKGEDISLEAFPSFLKLKKVNSFQDSQHGSAHCSDIPQRNEENLISRKETLKYNQSNIKQIPRKQFVCKKKIYIRQLQKQTKADLHNQQQTLQIIHTYLENIPKSKSNPKLLLPKKKPKKIEVAYLPYSSKC